MMHKAKDKNDEKEQFIEEKTSQSGIMHAADNVLCELFSVYSALTIQSSRTILLWEFGCSQLIEMIAERINFTNLIT